MVGGEDLDFDINHSSRLSFKKCWITKDNIVDLYQESMQNRETTEVDLVSVDLDGNDLIFCKELLEGGLDPRLFIVEYNARFAPPIRFSIDYDEDHEWSLDDYYGASLQSLVDLFSEHDYSLICCNAATGVNAFFVKNEDLYLFPEVPADISDIYSEPFFINHSGFLMPKSKKTFETIIK